MQPLAEKFAIPVTLNWRCDVNLSEIEQSKAGLQEALWELGGIVKWPKVFVVGCSLVALSQWIDKVVAVAQGRPQDAEVLKFNLSNATSGGVGPAVFGVGMEQIQSEASLRFLVDAG
jgi:hypothetical protein